jgi:hypothetical protein
MLGVADPGPPYVIPVNTRHTGEGRYPDCWVHPLNSAESFYSCLVVALRPLREMFFYPYHGSFKPSKNYKLKTKPNTLQILFLCVSE